MNRWKLLFVMVLLAGCGNISVENGANEVVSHDIWDALLKKYVTEDGWVDYKGIQSEKDRLDTYLQLLSDNPPNTESWSDADQIAYWINAYNAFTVDLILQHYPVESIKDIGSSIQIPFVNTPWDIKFIKIGGEEYDLNNLEHGILRKQWNEPRIHFAVNCASYSCPALRAEAYTGDELDEQLDEQASIFINDARKNVIENNEARLSKIFSWYSGDFNADMSVEAYINQYSTVKINTNTSVDYMDYDWSLNDIP